MRLVAAIAVLVCAPAWAQVTGRVTGSVADSSGAAVANGEVSLLLAGGTKPVLSVKTTEDGLFTVVGVRPETYTIEVSAPGFVKYTLRGIKVDPARETALPAIRLELAAVQQSVEVSASLQAVQTSNAEVSATVTNAQVRRLPVLDRDPLALIQTQAGVTVNGRSDTVINGQRTSYANVTLDGINIQDNYIRDNALDYTPNMLLLDQVSEFTVSTSNTNAAMGGGSAQVTFVTPSGTNALHGSAYLYNRNNYFAANDWFDNQAGVARPFLNQNQGGGSLGGPIRKDKLFFYSNYEFYRQRQQQPVNRTILTADARQGIFTYLDSQRNVHKVNVLQAAGVSFDPEMQKLLARVPGPEYINNFNLGDSSPDLLRNTAGNRFLKRNNRTRDNLLERVDYNHSTRHVFAVTYLYNRDDLDSPDPDADNDYSKVPKITNTNHSHLLSASWRWTPSATVTNEFRGGFNLAPGEFPTSEQFGSYVLDGMIYSNPVNTFRRQGRNTNTYNFADNAAWIRGRHNVQFGFQSQHVGVMPYDDAGITPVYTIGIGTGNDGLTTKELPGVRSTDLDTADALLASLAGYYSDYTQSFNIASRTSGFVSGAPYVRHFSLNDYAFYAQDAWKALPRLSVTLGLRYSLYGVASERDSLSLLPVVQNGNPIQTLLSNVTLDFAGASAGRPWYHQDRDNFAPNAGLAWDVFGNGGTAVRAGYSLHYVNDQTLLATETMADINAGLTSIAADTGLTGRVSQGLTPIPTPDFQVPRTVKDNYAIDPLSALGMIDPNLKTPYVQQWSFGIQQQIKGAIVEARYVGNHAVHSFRAFDYNQVIIRQNGFLDDFLRARANGNLALAATGRFDPSYTGPGTQKLNVFPLLSGGGRLTNSTNQRLIQRGEAGQLAAQYQTDGRNGSVNFFQNPYALGTDLLTNYSNSTYNALQVEIRRRAAEGLEFQANYTYSKVLSDSAGTSQSRLEHFLDLGNGKIERARADFDVTHSIKGNAVYDLPVLRRHRYLGGWAVSAIMVWQSGTPFSILSGRGTVNRTSGGRSDYNTATTILNKSELDSLLQFRMTGDGPYFVAESAIGPDGRAVASDGAAPFDGQVFFHPGPGELGQLQRRMFSGPWTFNADFCVIKETHIGERQTIEMRAEATNVFNHPSFVVDDQNIGSATFGRVTSTFSTPRLVQFGLHYRF